jgi:hypothetical protein
MSEDIFIKNPNRAATKTAAPYEPEHIRLNKSVKQKSSISAKNLF